MRALAVIVALAVTPCATALPTGCSRVDSSASNGATPGSIHFDLAADPSTLDPLFAHQDASSVDQEVADLVFEPFIAVDEHGRQVPELLAEIPTLANGGLSRDGRTIRYRLRRNVRWQDGAPVTARDVLFTLHAILDPRNPVRSRAGYDLIDRAQAPDPHTVVLHLRRAWAPAVSTFFCDGTAPQFVLPEHVLAHRGALATAPFNAAPIGDGPYRLVAWRRGERLVYAANPDYWRGPPKTARLELRIVPDPGTNLTLLESGAIDWNLIAPAQQVALRGRTDLAYRDVPLALIVGVAINVRRPPLDDVRVRRALAAAIDRHAISAKITYGKYPVIESAQPLFSWARDTSVHEPAYDPALADGLLDAAGWRRGPDGMRAKGGRALALTYVQFPESQTGVRTATVIQSELRARGIAVTIKQISNAQLFLPASHGGTLASGNFDLAYVPWPMGADPDESFLLACGGSENYMRYCNPEVDRLERVAVASTSRAVRKSAYDRIQRIVASDVPIIYLFNPAYVYAYRRRLDGFFPNAFSPTWNAADWLLHAASAR